VRYVKPAAAIILMAALAAPSPAASGISVLVEPLTPPAAPAASGAPAAPAPAVFSGILLSPPRVVLSSGDGKTAGAQLDLTKVLVLYFPTEQINALDAEIQTAKTELDKAMADKTSTETAKTTLTNALIALGKKKAALQASGIQAITTYKTGKFIGYFDEAKEKVKFLIEKTPTPPATVTDPPTEYTQDQLKAIYFLQPAATPAAPSTTSGQSSAAGEQADGGGDAWLTVSQQLKTLKSQRVLLAEQFTKVAKEFQAVSQISELEWASQPHPESREDVLAHLGVHRNALEQAIHGKDLVIEQLQIQIAFLPRPLPKKMPAPFEAFPHAICIQPLPDCDSASKPEDLLSTEAGQHNPYGSLAERVERLQSAPFDHRFEQPAHFPYPRFNRDGGRMNTEGAVIYEGMRFVATRDGQYDVSFTTTIPEMNVTLRLQLVFAGTDPDNCGFTITLPPLVFYPYTDFDGNAPVASYQVHHTGYSHAIAENFAELGAMTVARQGTARFGSWPEGINRFEALNVSAPAQTTPTASPAP
jgi:hypothetical protein